MKRIHSEKDISTETAELMPVVHIPNTILLEVMPYILSYIDSSSRDSKESAVEVIKKHCKEWNRFSTKNCQLIVDYMIGNYDNLFYMPTGGILIPLYAIDIIIH